MKKSNKHQKIIQNNKEKHRMNEVLNILKENQVQFFATVGRDGKAKVRPFSFCFEMDDKLWFGTNSTKEVYKDLEQNPYIELAVVTSDMTTLRLSGKVVFEDSKKVKEEMMNIPVIKMQYQTAENPILKSFYLQDIHATISDMTSNTPREYQI